MSLTIQIKALVDAIAGQFNTVSTRIGTLTSLNTTAKSSLVAAINEVKAASGGGGGGGALINDGAASTSSVFSSTKTQAVVTQALADMVGGAPSSLDTLKEISDKLATDDTALASLLTSVGNRIRFDAAQSISGPEQTQARANIGAMSAASIGDTEHDFVADFNAALTA